MLKSQLKIQKKLFFIITKTEITLLKIKLVLENLEIVDGSGVDLKIFNRKKLNKRPIKNSFIFFGRLMEEKGIIEYLKVAALIKKKIQILNFL